MTIVLVGGYHRSGRQVQCGLEFSLDVSEYLKGTGPSSIVAVWVDGRSYDTNECRGH